MLVPLDFYKTQIRSSVLPESTMLALDTEARKKLDKIGIGNYTYLTLMHGRFREVVKYNHVENFQDAFYKGVISVERDIQGTGRKTFPVGSCMAYVWVEQSIAEMERQGEADEVSE